MAARRPPMPRSGASGHDPQQATGEKTAASEAPQQRARPRNEEPLSGAHSARRASVQGAPARERTAAARPAENRAKVIPLGPVKSAGTTAPGQKRTAAAKPSSGPKSSSSPKVTAKPAPKSAAKPASKPKVKASASQRRIEDRNLLSGAVRKDEKSAKKAPGKSPGGPKKPIPARSFSGRLLALSIALSVFAVLLVPSIGTYSRQHDEISALRTSIEDKQVEQESLKDQIARWDDPLYIKQQARDRINLVMPGERNYMVVGTQPADDVEGEVNQSPEEVRTDLPWVDALFDSMQRAATD